MALMKELVDALFGKPHSTSVTINLPTPLFMALESYVYLRNETLDLDTYDPIDRDMVINHLLARFLAKQMIKVPESTNEVPKIKEPPTIYLKSDEFTEGRKQARRTTSYPPG